jgi:aryl-alcohol dehydrogenase-like predicted oxidoreductase
VFTKCSLVWGEEQAVRHDLSAASIRTEVEDSLRRLQVETIDLYQVHWPRWAAQAEPSPGSVAEAWQTLADLQQQGKLRHIGASNFTVEDLETAGRIAPVASLQPPYSMLRRAIEAEVLPYCEDHGIGVLVYSPMQSGLLTGAMTRERISTLAASDWRRNNKEFQEPQLSRNLALVEVLRAIGTRHGRTPGEVAIAWTLRHPAVTAAIVGGRSARQVDGVVGAMDFRLSAPELDEIERALPRD